MDEYCFFTCFPTDGIGTTAPVNALQVNSGRVVVGSTDIGNVMNGLAVAGSATNGNTYGFQAGQDSTHNLWMGWFANSTAASGYSAIGSFGGNNPLVLQNGGGNVGIGTTTPQAAVDVAGSIVLSDGNAFAINKYWSSGWKYKANGWGGHMQYFGTGGFGLFVNPQNSSGTGAAVTDIQALMVTPTGNVGIGITTPGQLLSVYGSITNGFMQGIYNTGGSTTSDGLAISAGSNSTAGAVMVYLIRPDGTAIGSITQNSATTVAYNTTSDRRIKENIADSASGLDLLTKIKVRDYNYIADPDKQTQQGFIAQELYDIYPQAVTVGGEDPKTHPWQVDYGKLTPLLVKSVQDLQSENDQLKARADKAEADIRAKDAAIAQLKAESANLKAALCAKFSDLPICASNLAE